MSTGTQRDGHGRRPWVRPSDRLAVLAIVLVLAAAGTALWLGSDARGTTSTTAAAAAEPEPFTAVPVRLRPEWSQRSPDADRPLVTAGTVATAADGQITGRTLQTGAPRWSYRRDRPLCTAATAWDQVVAVYRKGGLCSEVTALQATTGERSNLRNSRAPRGTHLLGDGSYLTATGQDRIETWRSDLVKTLQYGNLPYLVNPGKQPRPDCRYPSLGVGDGRVALVERCPSNTDDTAKAGTRITLQQAVPDNSDAPEVEFSTRIDERDARIIGVQRERVAVAVSDPPRVLLLDADGEITSSEPLPLPAGALTGEHPQLPRLTDTGSVVLWHVAGRTLGLNPGSYRARWSVPGTLGPGARVYSGVLLPTAEGYRVTDPRTGERLGTLATPGLDPGEPVTTAVAGSMLLDLRSGTLTALRMRP